MIRELEIIKYEMNRIKLDIDMLRLTTSSTSTSAWNASSLLYTRLEHIESEIGSITDKLQVEPHFICLLMFKLIILTGNTGIFSESTVFVRKTFCRKNSAIS